MFKPGKEIEFPNQYPIRFNKVVLTFVVDDQYIQSSTETNGSKRLKQDLKNGPSVACVMIRGPIQ